MQTAIARLPASAAAAARTVCRLGVLAVLACGCFAPATALGQLYGRPVAQPFFDFPTWARFSDCRPGPLPWGYDVFPDYGPMDCPCDMPPSVACPGDWVAHRPSTWYASADFAPLTIDHLDGYDLVAEPLPGGEVVLRSDDLRPEFDAGGKFTIGRRIFDCYRIEGTYMGDYEWHDSVVVTSDVVPGDLATFLTDFVDEDVDSAALAFEASFQSAEVNLRYWADMPPGPFDVSYLVGARFIQIDEEFNFVAVGGLGAGDALISTENEMVGVQIGIQGAWLLSRRWWFDFDLKGGMYNNRVLLDTSFIDGGAETGASISRDRTAWVGDISLVANWQMTPNWTFRIGYQALFMNGLALGHDNLVGNADLFGVDDARLDDSGELALHGPTIGLMWIR